MLTITHTREAGTLIEGTSRGDGMAAILKAQRWRWGSSIGSWFVPVSRDKAAKTWQIEATVKALQAAGHEVTVTIEDTPRDTATVEAARAERRAGYVERLEGFVERTHNAAALAEIVHRTAVDRLPPMGEPVKIDHHSAGRHRRDLDRAHTTMGKSVEADRAEEEAVRRLEEARRTDDARQTPLAVGRRIERIETDIRRLERLITRDVYHSENGYQAPSDARKAQRAERLAPRIAEAREQLAYWEAVRTQQIDTGEATDYGRHNVAKGDAVKIGDTWRRVARANAKTVTVETGYSWTDRAPWHSVTDHRTAAQLATTSTLKAE